ncbi:hypothetical protein [Streptomyces sp. NPDC048202]|uniref:hypothetical protein n=1 Tax=Streptomyces sp. NPDC048202 TaxID=3365514 RepID=UPI003720C172
MMSPPERDLSAAVRGADSPDWSVRAAAGRRLAASDGIGEVADVVHRLLLDVQDSGVTQETAEAMLARKDTAGLRCVLSARGRAVEAWTADQLQDALDGDPEWMTTDGADRLIRRLHQLAEDDDPVVRDEARKALSRLRPREEWARGPE